MFVLLGGVGLHFIQLNLRGLAAKLNELEHKLESHDQAIAGILNAIRELMKPPEPNKRPIGFVTGEVKPKKGG